MLALLLAGFGVLVCVVATAALPSTASGGRWSGAGMVVLGSLLVQGVAVLVGTGLGLLIRRPVLACLATIVLPLGLWWLLGAVAVLRPAQDWLTPYPSVGRLLSGQRASTSWLQWFVVLAIWGVGLNAVAVLRATRRRSVGPICVSRVSGHSFRCKVMTGSDHPPIRSRPSHGVNPPMYPPML